MLAFRGYYGLADGAYALYVIGTNRCGLRRLTDSIAGNPSWSPDGRWIAFDTSGSGEIWKVHPDGSGLTRIRGEGQDEQPAWSPDGTSIAFVHFQVGGGGEIWVMGADGSGATLLHKDAGASDERPAWSHDGKRIAFQVYKRQHSWIGVMKADGTDAWRTLRRRGDQWNPVWLPRDAGIAFLAWRSYYEDEGLFIMRPNGSRVQRVARLQGEQFAWIGGRLPQRRC